MQNIVVNFTSSAEGLQPGIEGLVQLEVADKKVAEQAKKTMQSYSQRDKTITDGAKGSGDSIEQLSTKVKNLDKAIVGGAYKQVYGDLQAELKKTGADFEVLSAIVQQAEKQLAKLPQDSKDFKALSGEIQKANEVLDQMISNAVKQDQEYTARVEAGAKQRKRARDSEGSAPKAGTAPATPSAPAGEGGTVPDPVPAGAEEKVKSLKLQLRELTAELAKMELQGMRNTEEYNHLLEKAGELKQGIHLASEAVGRAGSDTRAMDNLIGLTGAVAGGFALAQGSAALFGSENEEVQKALLKVNAAMAILQGLQQIQDVMSKQQYGTIAAVLGLKEADVAVTVAQGEAVVGTTVATEGATFATKVWNTVLKQNPLLWILAGITAVVAAIKVFSSRTSESSAAQKALNEAREKSSDTIATEQANLSGLLVVAKDELLSKEQRGQALDDIRAKYPEYLSNLKAENLNTKEVSLAIEKQIDLIRKRAFAQATQEVYKDKLKEQIQAQNEVNKTLETGGGFWTKLWTTAVAGGNLATANQLAVNSSLDKMEEKTKEATGTFNVFLSAQKDLAETAKGTKDSIQQEIDQVNNLITASNDAVERSILAVKKRQLEAKKASAPDFDPDSYEKTKKAALETAQAQVDAAKNGSVQELEAKRDLAKKKYDEDIKDARLTTSQKAVIEATYKNELEQSDIEFRNRNYRDTVNHYEALAIIEQAYGREGSAAYYNARKNALKQAAEEAKAQEGVTAGEIFKINAQLQLDLANLEIEQKAKRLAKQKDIVDGAIALVKQGSAEELALKLQQAQVERDQQLNQLNITAEARTRIEAEYLKKVRDMNKEYNYLVQSDAIAIQQSGINARISQLQISNAEQTNAELVKLKKDSIDQQAAQEILGVQKSVQNEELKQAKIKEIQLKALLDKKAIDDEKNRADIDEGKNSALSIYDREIAKQNLVLENAKSTEKQKQAAQERIFDLTKGRIDAEELANQQLYDAGLETFDQYLAQKQSLQTAADENDLKREQNHQQQLTQIRDLALQVIGNIENVFSGINQQNYEEEKQKVQDLYDKKKISETEYQNRMKAIKKKQAEDDKAMAIFQTLIQQGPTILKAFQTGGFAGIAAGFTLFFALLSAVQGAKPPAFKDGEVDINGPGTSTSDSILARISAHESVINAKQTSKHKEALKAINEDRYGKYLVQHELPKLYANMSMPAQPQLVQTVTHQQQSIDYKLMAKAFAQELADNPHVSINMDESGFHVSVQKGIEQTDYVNKKLNL